VIGVIVATHGRMAQEMLACAEAIVGKVPRATAISVGSDIPVDQARDSLAVAIHDLDDGDGVLILTDMLGGTPSNLALGFLNANVEVVAGVNLPMLLKTASCRAEPASLRDIARLLEGYGRKSIALASELLRDRARQEGADVP
jgi:PTS system mannose-specific IIA component